MIFIDFRDRKFVTFVQFFSAGFWNWIIPIFWHRVYLVIWCAYKKNFRMKISKSSFEVLILVAYPHIPMQKQAKSMKIDENQWKPRFWLVFHDGVFVHFVNFLSPDFWNQKYSIYWNRVYLIIWYAYKKNFRMKFSKTSHLVLMSSCIQWQKWSDSPIPPWETFLVGIGLDFEYNETGNHWFFWNVAVFPGSQLSLEMELDRFKIY